MAKKWFSVVLQLLPIVMQVVAEIERLFGSKPGPDKHKRARALTLDLAQSAGVSVTEDVSAAVDSTIKGVVSRFNDSGLFQKSPKSGKGKK